MPRAAVLFEYPTLNGGERSLLSVLPMLRGVFDICAIAPQDGPLAVALAHEGVTHLAYGGRPGLALDDRRRELAEILRAHPVDLLHANSLAMTRLAAPVARDLGIPCVGHVRDIVKLGAAARRDVGSATQLVAVSEAVRAFHIDEGLDDAPWCVAHNGVDLEEFRACDSRDAIRAELEIPRDAPIVTTIGQIGLRKGLDVWAEAAGLIAVRHPAVHFIVAGERHSEKDESIRLEEDVRAAALRDPLRGRCRFVGFRNDVPEILGGSDILLHCARQEPLGRVLLEAAASGVAVVATDVGGTREIFPDERSGARLAPDGDGQGLADAVIALLEQPAVRLELGRAARRRIESAFEARRAGEALLAIYRDVVGSSSTKAAPRSDRS